MNDEIYATLSRPVLLTVPTFADFYGRPTGHELAWFQSGTSVRVIGRRDSGDYEVSVCRDPLPAWFCGLVSQHDLVVDAATEVTHE
jgi:hypothetical protein